MELQSLRETSQGHIEKHHILEKELNEVKEEYIRVYRTLVILVEILGNS